MVLDLMLVGLAITLEPFPLTAFILVLSAEKGIWKGLAFILGWLACLVAVIAAVIVTLLAGRQRRRMGRPRKPPGWMARLDRLSLGAAAGLAVFLQPWALVAAGAATVVQARLSTTGDYLTLVLFCLLATASFLYLELYTVFAPAAATTRLRRMRTWLDTHQDQVIVIVLLLLGFWLAGNSIYLLVS